MRKLRHPEKKPLSGFGLALRLALLALALLAWALLGAGCAPEIPAVKTPPRTRDARLALYEKTLRAFLKAGTLPLIDLDLSLGREADLPGIVRAMDRAGVALAALTSPREAVIQAAVRRRPGRFIPLTAEGRGDAWAREGGSFLEETRRRLARGAFGIGRLTLRAFPPIGAGGKEISVPLAGGTFEALLRLAAERKVPLWIRMDPDDETLGRFERLLRAHPGARVVWTGAGRILRPDRLPGYGHGLLRALSQRRPGLFFVHAQGIPAGDRLAVRHRPLVFYDPDGEVSPEWRAMLEARSGRFGAGSGGGGAHPDRYLERMRGFRSRVLGALTPSARPQIAYRSAWRLLTGRAWKD
ncbi:MAG: hypothetical protein V3V62_13790 [bacterium]